MEDADSDSSSNFGCALSWMLSSLGKRYTNADDTPINLGKLDSNFGKSFLNFNYETLLTRHLGYHVHFGCCYVLLLPAVLGVFIYARP